MRESNFINQNKSKWEEFEKILNADKKDPDKLSNLFIQISDDLSYSRTFYRNRSVRIYLNNLAQRIFSSLYRNKKSRAHHFTEFWKEELPQLVWQSRRSFLIIFLVFVLSVVIGVFSCRYFPDFPRVILGDRYVDMTLENIGKKDPMAVYKDLHAVDMFLGITYNNLQVSLVIFLFGLFFSIGSVGLIISNGVMVGTFQYFFYREGLFAESALAIWMHGTLEMSAMVIAGAAGMTMGNGLVFPGTFTRGQSFMISARRGLKIVLGIAPIITLAAIIESFVTRFTQLPDWVRLCVILFSLFFILGYFVWYPWRKARAGFKKPIRDAQIQPNGDMLIITGEIKTNGELFKDVFTLFRKHFKIFIYVSLGLAGLYTLLAFFISPSLRDLTDEETPFFYIITLFNYTRQPALFFLNTVIMAMFFIAINYRISRETKPGKPEARFSFSYLLRQTWKCLFISVLINCIILLQNGWTTFLLLTVMPFLFLLLAVMNEKPRKDKRSSILIMYTLALESFWKFAGLYYLLLILLVLFFVVLDSPFVFLYFQIISWNFLLDSNSYTLLLNIFQTFTSILGLGIVLPILMSGMSLLYYSLDEIHSAGNLLSKIGLIGSKTATRK